MNYLVITATETIYADTATQAAVHAGFEIWNRTKIVAAINALAVGDELSINDDVSIFRLSGVDKDFVA